MGRGKIKVALILNQRTTFLKRKNGLIKKAMEISIMCDCEVAFVAFSPTGRMYSYYSGKPGQEQEIQDNKESMQSFFDNLPKRFDYLTKRTLTDLDYASQKQITTAEVNEEIDLEESTLLYLLPPFSSPLDTKISTTPLITTTIEEIESSQSNESILPGSRSPMIYCGDFFEDDDEENTHQDFSSQPPQPEISEMPLISTKGKRGSVKLNPSHELPVATKRKNNNSKKNQELSSFISSALLEDETNSNITSNKKIRTTSPQNTFDLSKLFTSPTVVATTQSPSLHLLSLSPITTNSPSLYHGNNICDQIPSNNTMASSHAVGSLRTSNTNTTSITSLTPSSSYPITQIQGSPDLFATPFSTIMEQFPVPILNYQLRQQLRQQQQQHPYNSELLPSSLLPFDATIISQNASPSPRYQNEVIYFNTHLQ